MKPSKKISKEQKLDGKTIFYLSQSTPMSTIAPMVLTGPLGALLASDIVAFRRNLNEQKVIKVARTGHFANLNQINSAAALLERLSRLQPAKKDVAINAFAQYPSSDLEELQATILQTCFTGAAALVLSQGLKDEKTLPDVTQAIRLAFSATPAGFVFRDQLGNWGGLKPVQFESTPKLPGLPKFASDLIVQADTLLKSTCAKVAVAALKKWADSMAAASPQYLINVIHSLNPRDACPGDLITLHGSGFGKANRATVVFTGLGGSNVLVPRSDVKFWNDTIIEVIVPKDARRGPVGIVVFPDYSEVPLAEASSTALGELMHCFGPQAIGRVSQTLSKFSHPVLTNPVLLPNDANLFIGGPPVIRRFDTRSHVLHPQQSVIVDWIVDGADRVEIVARSISGSNPHELPTIGGHLDPSVGSVTVIVPGSRRWRGEYVLRAFNRCTGTTGPIEAILPLEMALRQGLALGGGGTRGDFQVGALLYLYDQKAFRPEAIAATSVGAVNAIDLLMGDDPGRSAAQRLRDTWLSLNTESDMWADEPWLAGLKTNVRVAIRSLSIEGLLAMPYAIGKMGVAAADVNDLANNMRGRGAVSLFNIDPIEARIRAQFDSARASASGIRLRLVSVSVDTGEIVQVNETGQVIESAVRVPIVPSGVGPAPAPDVVDGAVASAAMPGIFRSRRIGNHNAVDGGVRDVVPVGIAIRDLGCNRVIAIRCSAPPTLEPLDPARAFPSVMARSVLELTFDEVAENDINPFNGWGTGVEVTTIQPSFNLHDPMVIEPGLIQIAMDYGWMRAADIIDVPLALRQRAMALCDEIIQLRVQNWHLAHDANGDRRRDPHRSFTNFLLQGLTPIAPPQLVRVPDSAAVTQVRANAKTIRELVAHRMAMNAPVPAPAVRNSWFQQWERFGTGSTLLMPNPWSPFNSRRDSLPAETVPPPL